jgi:hypothetical protein
MPLATGSDWAAERSALLDGRAYIAPAPRSEQKKGPNGQIRKSPPFSSSSPDSDYDPINLT